MLNEEFISLTESYRSGDQNAILPLLKLFEGLIYHYKTKCLMEDICEELNAFLIELLGKINLEGFKKQSGNGLQRYIAVSIGHEFIKLSKEYDRKKAIHTSLDRDMGYTPDLCQGEILRETLSVLTPRQQDVMIYKYIYKYSDIEIGKSLNISRQAVNQIKNRSVEILKGVYIK